MERKGLKRNIFQRIFGIPATRTPQDSDCWEFNDGVLTVDVDKSPELQKDKGAIRLEGDGLPVRVLIYKGDDGKFRAARNQCTHVGRRRLDPVPGSNCVQCCSVMGSKFEYDGERISGAARHPIKVYEVNQEDNILTINL